MTGAAPPKRKRRKAGGSIAGKVANVRPDRRAKGGETGDQSRYASDKWWFADEPQLRYNSGSLSPEEMERFISAKRAATSAQENMNDQNGVVPDYNNGQRYTSPDDATKYPAYRSGGHLTATKRHGLPSSDFALPGKGEGSGGKGSGSYPIPDERHGRAALSRAAQHASPAERATIKRKVKAKFPGIDVS